MLLYLNNQIKTIMKNLTTKQKRNLLTQLIILQDFCGYDASEVAGRPLSYFNFDKVQVIIKELIVEWENINGCEYTTPYVYSLEN